MVVCTACAAMVSATYRVRDVQFDDGSGVAKGLLVAVCDGCGDVCCIPSQSTPAIWSNRHKLGNIRVEITFRQASD